MDVGSVCDASRHCGRFWIWGTPASPGGDIGRGGRHRHIAARACLLRNPKNGRLSRTPGPRRVLASRVGSLYQSGVPAQRRAFVALETSRK
jgi:hypothetical protein